MKPFEIAVFYALSTMVVLGAVLRKDELDKEKQERLCKKSEKTSKSI